MISESEKGGTLIPCANKIPDVRKNCEDKLKKSCVKRAMPER